MKRLKFTEISIDTRANISPTNVGQVQRGAQWSSNATTTRISLFDILIFYDLYQDINTERNRSSLFVKSNQSTIQSFTNETLTFRARRNEKFRHQNQLGKWKKKKEKAMPLKLLFVSLRQWRGLWMDICNPVTYIFSSSFSGNRVCHLSRVSNESKDTNEKRSD